MNNRMAKFVMLLPLFLIAAVGFVALGGYVVMRLWNWLLPSLFGFHPIAFWQALGLLALCRILFGGLGLHSRGGPLSRRRMHEGWGRMSPEERERMRERMREKFGFGPTTGESQGK